MLRNIIKESYQEITGHAEPVQAVVTVSENRPAANSSNFSQAETQARRLRRQERQAGGGQGGSFGWRLRTW